MYTVVKQVLVPAPPQRTWEYLTDPAKLSQWMADTDRFGPGREGSDGRFRLDFGDGDFFAGTILEWSKPWRLRFHWRFMAIGPQFEITYLLNPLPGGATELSILDRGALSVEELDELRQGWADFASRLVRRVRTGASARYGWSREIGLSGILKGLGGDQPPELEDAVWWKSAFPDVDFELEEGRDRGLKVRFHDAAWGPVVTEAALHAAELDGSTCLAVTHGGWTGLPEAGQFTARRKFAGLWCDAIGGLERQYSLSGSTEGEESDGGV